MMHVLSRSKFLPVPRAELFEFFEDPRNLGKMTPEGMGFKILKMDDLPITPGFRIKYRIKILGSVPIRWLTTITEYEQGEGFVDEQTKGPYAYWRHEHRFEDVEGGTMMHDRVQYRLPFGILGVAVQRLVVARELDRIFDYRERTIEKMYPRALVPA